MNIRILLFFLYIIFQSFLIIAKEDRYFWPFTTFPMFSQSNIHLTQLYSLTFYKNNEEIFSKEKIAQIINPLPSSYSIISIIRTNKLHRTCNFLKELINNNSLSKIRVYSMQLYSQKELFLEVNKKECIKHAKS